MSEYNLHTIREMLGEAFSSGEITTLAFDLFQDVYQDFATGMTRSQKIEMVVTAANSRGKVPDLLAYVQRHNGYQYGRFADQLISESSPQDPALDPKEPSPPAITETEPTFGIITALPKELAAMSVMLDDGQKVFKSNRDEHQEYIIGRIPSATGNPHTIVLALMLDMGNNPAAILATRLLNHFPSVNDIIMVGIAGGVPNAKKPDDHVRLGDIVVSDRNGVVQYDYIKKEIEEDKHRYPPRPPRASLLAAVKSLESNMLQGIKPWLNYFDRANDLFNSQRPPVDSDKLYNYYPSGYKRRIKHPYDPKRVPDQPRIFSGTIASANILQKDPFARDKLGKKFGVKAIEMEGSGVADATWTIGSGYLVVRGICDYCDPSKNDDWQEYAAVAASAYTRALLESVPNLE